jgi:flagellar protein FlgJ
MEINAAALSYYENYHTPALAGTVQEQNKIPGKAFSEILDKARSLEKQPQNNENDKLYEQCLELETFLIKNLLSSMRKTIQKSGLINEGFAEKMYEDMLYDEYAKEFAKNANFGLAKQAYLELTGQRGIKTQYM